MDWPPVHETHTPNNPNVWFHLGSLFEQRTHWDRTEANRRINVHAVLSFLWLRQSSTMGLSLKNTTPWSTLRTVTAAFWTNEFQEGKRKWRPLGPRRAPGARECQQPVSKASAAWALTVITPQVSKWVSSDLSVASSGPATTPKESHLWLRTRCQHAVAVASSVISDCQIQSGGGGEQYLWFILYNMIKYRTIVWNEGQRSIPVEWLSCLYKALRNCAANSTHPSQPSGPSDGT